jgi:hypothetical protein
MGGLVILSKAIDRFRATVNKRYIVLVYLEMVADPANGFFKNEYITSVSSLIDHECPRVHRTFTGRLELFIFHIEPPSLTLFFDSVCCV